MLLSLMIACATSHHGTDSETTYRTISDPYGARLLMDGETAQSAVAKGTNGGKSVVSVLTNVEANPFHRESTTQVVISPAYGAVSYAAGTDPQLMQAVQISDAYRRGRGIQDGLIPGAKNTPVFKSALTPTGTTSAVELDAKCPSGDPATQAERDACQDADMDYIVGRLPVSK